MPPIKSPWGETFDEFASSIQDAAIIAAPFISREPVERLAARLRRPESVKLDLLTNLDGASLIDGLVDAAALARLCERVPGAAVRHLRFLHAKAYVADGRAAIVTSANLTNGGLRRNYELGIFTDDPQEVRDISRDLREYAGFGVPVPLDALYELSEMSRAAQRHKASLMQSADAERNKAIDAVNSRFAELRTLSDEFAVNPQASINAKFADAVKYILSRNGSLPTREINLLVQELMPEWCDDSVDRVINGVSFGRKWKHQVRNAQVHLRRTGVIAREGNRWRLL